MSRSRQWPPRIVNFRGRARVRIEGRDYYLGTYGSAEAAREYARIIEAGPNGPLSASESLTVNEVVVRFLAHAEATYDPAGGQLVRFKHAFGPLLQECGDCPAAEFRVAHLESVRGNMVSRDWCRNHINRQVVRIRTMFRWAEQQGFLPEGRWSHLRTLKALSPRQRGVRNTVPRRPCTREELDAVKAQAQPAVAAMLEVQWLAGLRSCEVRIMRPADLDTTGEVWLYTPEHHKTEHLGQSRVIALGPECQRVLVPWISKAPPDVYLFRGLVARRRKGENGTIGNKPYDCCTYARAVRRAADRAGVADFSGYQCRHAFKARVAKAHGLEAARAAMGQKSIQATAGYAQAQDVQAAIDIARRAG